MTHEPLRHGSKVVDTIFVHQATTRPGWMEGRSAEEKRDEIDRWHKARGWSGFGYHWLIDRDGTAVPGRSETQIGAHVRNYNRGSIGICLVGGHGASKTDEFEEHFTEEQDVALRKLIDEIKSRANIKRVRGHSEVANKACPGFTVAKWLMNEQDTPDPNKALANSRKAKTVVACRRGIAGIGIGYSTWEAAKFAMGEASQGITMMKAIFAEIGWVPVLGFVLLAYAVLGYLLELMKDDVVTGKYVPVETVE